MAHLDWLRAVISFGRHDAGRIIAGRHVDGRVENGALDVVKVAERVARSLVANCVVWSQLVDVTAEEPPAAMKETEKRWANAALKLSHTHELSSGYSKLFTNPTRPLKLLRSPAPRLT